MQKILSILVLALTTLINTVYSSDADILQYALILENLEATFYAEGVQMFNDADFQAAGLSGQYNQFQLLAQEEADHVNFLTGALKAANVTPLAACNYSFGFTTVLDFVATARAVESVGVSAYIGAINQISNAAYTTAAATITTIEARHQAYLDIISNASGFPQSFDTPLPAAQVVTLISPFITSCPFTIPYKASPALNISGSGPAGSSITINNLNNTNEVYCSFLYGSKQSWSPVTLVDGQASCVVPEDISAGIIYVYITSDNQTAISLTDSSSIEFGPAIFAVTGAANNNGNNATSDNNGNSDSTNNISNIVNALNNGTDLLPNNFGSINGVPILNSYPAQGVLAPTSNALRKQQQQSLQSSF